MVGRPFHRSGSGRYVILEVREWSGGPPEGPGVVGKPFRRFVSGRYVIPAVWEWSGGPPKVLGLVGRPSRSSGSCCDALLEVRDW